MRLARERTSNSGEAGAEAKQHYNVYVVALDRKVLEHKRFRDANPDYGGRKGCVYVGMTGLSPDERFSNHKKGHKANAYVKKYGKYLRWRLFRKYNPMTFEEASRREQWLAQRLRKKGYAVWQH